jgi:ferritin
MASPLFPNSAAEGILSVKNKNILLSEECITTLQFRIQQEEQSSRLYQAMSLWLNNSGYSGAASLWSKYAKEELVHAEWSRNYLLAMGITPSVPMLAAQPNLYSGLPEIIEQSYNHEVLVTKQCKDLADKALKAGDHMLYTLAGQYLKEQIEELDKMQTWLDKLSAFGTDKIAMRLLDNDMGDYE